MATQTKAGLIQQCDAYSQENTRLWQALTDVLKGKDVLVGKFTADGWHVTVRLIRPLGAHGGILLIDSKQDDKNSSMSVGYLEEEHRYFQHAYQNGEYGYQMREMVGRAMTMRNKALDAQLAA